MRKPKSYTALEAFGRVRLSRYYFMRDFLYSEIANHYGRPNIPDEPDLAIEAGRAICQNLLDPLTETFGPLAIRSGFRSAELNHFGATEVKPQKCASNKATYAGHIWDHLDGAGQMGACVCLVVPWFADQYAQGRDWRDLAYWIHDHLPYSEIFFFPKLAAFNLTWSQMPRKMISGYMPKRITLLKAGAEPEETLALRQSRYSDFPAFRAIAYPNSPQPWSLT